VLETLFLAEDVRSQAEIEEAKDRKTTTKTKAASTSGSRSRRQPARKSA